MCSSVGLSRRQAIMCHLIIMMLKRLIEANSTNRSLHECVEYPGMCSKEAPSHNYCTINHKNQRCHYSKNDSLQMRGLLSLSGQYDDIPGSPSNFSISVKYIESQNYCFPVLKFSWMLPHDRNSTKWLTGFALNVSYFYNNKNRQIVRIFLIEDKDKLPNKDTVYEYECFLAIPGVDYSATIYSLPTNLQNIMTQNVSVSCSTPDTDHRATKWRANLDVSVLNNGSLLVFFMPAPKNFGFTGYRVWLSAKKCKKINSSSKQLIVSRCPGQGTTVLNPTGLDIHKDYTVCVQPDSCVRCMVTALDIGPIDVTTTRKTRPSGFSHSTNVTTTCAPEEYPVEAIVTIPVLILIISTIILSVRICRTKRHRHEKGINTRKKYVFLIYDNEVKLYFLNVIERLSTFIELCSKHKVVSIDSCSSLTVLKRRIALADSVLIMCSEDAVNQQSAGRCEVWQDSDLSIDDIFVGAIKIIKNEFQTGDAYMKFRQIILPCFHYGSAGILDLKVEKTFHLTEFIQEQWENSKIMSNNSVISTRDFKKCNKVFKELEQAVSTTSCFQEKCTNSLNKNCQHFARNLSQQGSNDSGITFDDNSFRCLSADHSSPQSCCTALFDTHMPMTRMNSHCRCLNLERECQNENTVIPMTNCRLLESGKESVIVPIIDPVFQQEIDIFWQQKTDSFFNESRDSCETISLSSFLSKAGKLNDEFDRNLQAAGTA